MKRLNKHIALVLLISVLAVTSCTNQTFDSKPASIDIPPITNQSEALLNLFTKSGDYINGVESPYLISAEELNDNKENYLLIDTRYHEEYAEGHIDGALNVDREMLIDFLKSINIYQYHKVIIIDNTGQASTYITSMLRAIGYGSTYALKYGMTSWNEKIVNQWSKNIGDKYSKYLTSEPTKKNKKGAYPTINTKGKTISEILEIRAEKEIKFNFAITIDKLVENIDDYYVVNYISESRYNLKHLKGSVWYQPKKSMNINKDLSTLPIDKKIVIYCYIGHQGSALVAYLRLLGYDAYSLRYGTNSFMYNFSVKNKWPLFNTNDMVNNFELVTGSVPSKEVKAKANKIINPDLNFKRHDVILPDPSEVCD
ncbi:MAG: rhodanese-like domain-containing protein [Bacteroidales bacterium]|nr:rhodanese-like domain-containing protein [Bacteroidales bacterium]